MSFGSSDEEVAGYLDSVNFKYVAGLNNIFGMSSAYSQVSDMVLGVAAGEKVFENKGGEPGEE